MALDLIKKLAGGAKTSFELWGVAIVAMALFITGPLPAWGQQSGTPPANQSVAITATPQPAPPPPPEGASPQDKDSWDKWNVIAAVVSAIGTMAAAIAAFWSFKSAKQAETTAKAQRLSDLWPTMEKLEYLSEEELKRLNDQDVANIVIDNVNAMEKLGLWWHANLIDRTIMAHELGTGFIELYDQINGLEKLEKLNRTGTELILENPFITELYRELPKYIATKILN